MPRRDWDSVKDLIEKLYIKDKRTVKEVREMLNELRGFEIRYASENEHRTMILTTLIEESAISKLCSTDGISASTDFEHPDPRSSTATVHFIKSTIPCQDRVQP